MVQQYIEFRHNSRERSLSRVMLIFSCDLANVHFSSSLGDNGVGYQMISSRTFQSSLFHLFGPKGLFEHFPLLIKKLLGVFTCFLRSMKNVVANDIERG